MTSTDVIALGAPAGLYLLWRVATIRRRARFRRIAVLAALAGAPHSHTADVLHQMAGIRMRPLYRLLDRLEHDGLVTTWWVRDSAGQRTCWCGLTQTGHDHLAALLRAHAGSAAQMRLLARLARGALRCVPFVRRARWPAVLIGLFDATGFALLHYWWPAAVFAALSPLAWVCARRIEHAAPDLQQFLDELGAGA